MKKSLLLLQAFLLSIVCFSQNLLSPDQFLGYKLGTHFTPHYKIVNYVRYLAMSRPEMIKVEKYGETYEGRELLLAYVATPDHIKQLEGIRQNNLRIAGILKDGQPATTNAPAIVWLSYNVHGNEPSSSEAAMQTLYVLLNPGEARAQEYLQNTVVIIDPCLNPDGRDRYVNWFNSVSGKSSDPNPQSREHIEPWPQGRSNHYNFDLNRDWAWQTQIETQQRLVKYNQWMPQVHVDFHEQYYNNPYYFAPAAEPFHEVITPWQRQFQTTIGKNHAKYFDQQGWLYFTKESFDLFYPSYGDTYPTYNGSIGMTYEQGGHSRGGLAVTTANGDTLTLVDRVAHHFTTSLSTVEVASQNAGKLVSEFSKFFADNKTGKGSTYRTYVLTSDNLQKIRNVGELLTRNGIEYGSVGSTAFKGFNYNNKKQETGKLKKYNLAVSMQQPRSTLAKVLLEPASNLVDSNTYDITAWAIPYSYGVDAYAVKETLPLQAFSANLVQNTVAASPYGYLIKYNCIESAKLLGQLLRKGIKVRYAEKAFTYKGKEYERGTLITLVKGNPTDLANTITQLVKNNGLEAEVIETGFVEKGPDFGSPFIRFIQTPKVALVTGDQTSSLNAGEVWHLFDQVLEYPVTLINAADLGRAKLSDFNVLIFPNGNYRGLSDKDITERLKEYVKTGGKLIALENAVKQLATAEWGIKEKEQKTETKPVDYSALKRFEDRERDQISDNIPGAIYKVVLDETHPLAFGYADTYYSIKQNDNIYEFLKDGWNVGVIKKNNLVSGFAGSTVKSKLVDGVVFGVQPMGAGSVVYLVDNPLFRQFWENGKLLFANAVFLVTE
ncbi:MAG: family carboxypeptidase [Segetibacter sp.]|nr:family carboxypeptidase [Segetibacter sp.]